MAIQLSIAGTVYNFPVAGESPNWGAEATEAIVAIVDALNSLLGPGDILQTSETIENDITVANPINGLIFDSNVVRAATISYTIYRTSSTNPAGHSEVSKAFIIYDDNASIGQKWKITIESNGDAGVALSISDSGQVSYLSTNIGTSSYSGTIVFTARTLPR